MKRPSGQSAAGQTPRRPIRAKTDAGAGHPRSVPANTSNLEIGKQKQVVRIGRRISAKSVTAKPTRAATARKSSGKAAKELTKRQLLRLGKTGRRVGAQNLSAQARRFTAYSRRRRTVLTISIGSTLALLGLVLATIFTPLLAVEKITVTGLNRLKEATIQKALQPLQGVPLTLISENSISDALSKFSLIESFSIVAVPPHEVIVKVVERTPIAIVRQNGVEYLYDPAGIRLGKAGEAKLPRIELNNDPKSSAEFRAAIDVILALPADLLGRVASINAKSKDDVTLELRGAAGQKIIWGDGSNSVLKSKVLAALIKNHKKSDSVTFDVSSPNAPVVRY